MDKAELEASVAAWHAKMAQPAAKSVNPRDAALIKAIWQALAPVIVELERRVAALEGADR